MLCFACPRVPRAPTGKTYYPRQEIAEALASLAIHSLNPEI